MNECQRRIGDVVTYCFDMNSAAKDADALAMITEWKQFRMPDWKHIRTIMKSPIIVDGRNIYDMKELHEAGFTYTGIGKSVLKA